MLSFLAFLSPFPFCTCPYEQNSHDFLIAGLPVRCATDPQPSEEGKEKKETERTLLGSGEKRSSLSERGHWRNESICSKGRERER